MRAGDGDRLRAQADRRLAFPSIRLSCGSPRSPLRRHGRASHASSMACSSSIAASSVSPGSRRRSSTISQSSGMTLSAIPPAIRVTLKAGVADQRMVEGPQLAITCVEHRHELARREDRIHAELRAAGMRGLTFGADERPQTTFVRGEDGVVGRLADNDQVGLGSCFASAREPPPLISSSATNIRISVPRQRSRSRGEEPASLSHGRDRTLGVASASAEKLAVPLRQAKRIAGPAAADWDRVHMRVEGETGAVAIVDSADDIRAAIREGTNLVAKPMASSSDASSAAASASRPGGFWVSMATSRSSRPMSRATSGAGARVARLTALSPSPRPRRRFRPSPAALRKSGRTGSSPRRHGLE